MNIGKLDYAKSFKRLWQPVQLYPLVLDAEHVGLCECGASNMRQAERKRTQRSVWSFGTAIRRDTPALVPSNRSRHILKLIGRGLPG